MSSARDEGIMVNMRLRCLICTNTPEYEPLRALFRQKAMFLFPSLFMKSYVSLISIYYFNSLFVSKRTKKNHIRLWLLVLWETRLKTTTQVIPPVFCFYSFFQTIFSWLFWNNLLSSKSLLRCLITWFFRLITCPFHLHLLLVPFWCFFILFFFPLLLSNFCITKG